MHITQFIFILDTKDQLIPFELIQRIDWFAPHREITKFTCGEFPSQTRKKKEPKKRNLSTRSLGLPSLKRTCPPEPQLRSLVPPWLFPHPQRASLCHHPLQLQ